MESRAVTDKVLTHFRECIPIFQAMLDPYRQDIVVMLCEHGALTVKQITDRTTLSRSAISHHLQVLKAIGLASSDKRGTEQYYTVHLTEATHLLKNLVTSLEEKNQELS